MYRNKRQQHPESDIFAELFICYHYYDRISDADAIFTESYLSFLDWVLRLR